MGPSLVTRRSIDRLLRGSLDVYRSDLDAQFRPGHQPFNTGEKASVEITITVETGESEPQWAAGQLSWSGGQATWQIQSHYAGTSNLLYGVLTAGGGLLEKPMIMLSLAKRGGTVP